MVPLVVPLKQRAKQLERDRQKLNEMLDENMTPQQRQRIKNHKIVWGSKLWQKTNPTLEKPQGPKGAKKKGLEPPVKPHNPKPSVKRKLKKVNKIAPLTEPGVKQLDIAASQQKKKKGSLCNNVMKVLKIAKPKQKEEEGKKEAYWMFTRGIGARKHSGKCIGQRLEIHRFRVEVVPTIIEEVEEIDLKERAKRLERKRQRLKEDLDQNMTIREQTILEHHWPICWPDKPWEERSFIYQEPSMTINKKREEKQVMVGSCNSVREEGQENEEIERADWIFSRGFGVCKRSGIHLELDRFRVEMMAKIIEEVEEMEEWVVEEIEDCEKEMEQWVKEVEEEAVEEWVEEIEEKGDKQPVGKWVEEIEEIEEKGDRQQKNKEDETTAKTDSDTLAGATLVCSICSETDKSQYRQPQLLTATDKEKKVVEEKKRKGNGFWSWILKKCSSVRVNLFKKPAPSMNRHLIAVDV